MIEETKNTSLKKKRNKKSDKPAYLTWVAVFAIPASFNMKSTVKESKNSHNIQKELQDKNSIKCLKKWPQWKQAHCDLSFTFQLRTPWQLQSVKMWLIKHHKKSMVLNKIFTTMVNQEIRQVLNMLNTRPWHSQKLCKSSKHIKLEKIMKDSLVLPTPNSGTKI